MLDWVDILVKPILAMAGLWLMVRLGRGMVRLALRAKKNLCHRCGYSVADLRSTRCPECGSAGGTESIVVPKVARAALLICLAVLIVWCTAPLARLAAAPSWRHAIENSVYISVAEFAQWTGNQSLENQCVDMLGERSHDGAGFSAAEARRATPLLAKRIKPEALIVTPTVLPRGFPVTVYWNYSAMARPAPRVGITVRHDAADLPVMGPYPQSATVNRTHRDLLRVIQSSGCFALPFPDQATLAFPAYESGEMLFDIWLSIGEHTTHAGRHVRKIATVDAITDLADTISTPSIPTGSESWIRLAGDVDSLSLSMRFLLQFDSAALDPGVSYGIVVEGLTDNGRVVYDFRMDLADEKQSHASRFGPTDTWRSVYGIMMPALGAMQVENERPSPKVNRLRLRCDPTIGVAHGATRVWVADNAMEYAVPATPGRAPLRAAR